ncbi:hypothetical protein ACH5RR_024576 [Cinchona calisaya]|uniref:Uncharacterized protein n=1 Tax=Cinchona calisaya TaxID=153742 RepID=A0ABD2YX41_9GENT
MEEEPLKKSNSLCYRIRCYPEKKYVQKGLFERAENTKWMKVVWPESPCLLSHQKDVASEEEVESRQRDSKDQNFIFLRGSSVRNIIRFRFQTDGETSFVRKAFYRGLKVVSSAFEPIPYNRSVFLRTHDLLFVWSSRAFFGCDGSNPIREHMGNEDCLTFPILGALVCVFIHLPSENKLDPQLSPRPLLGWNFTRLLKRCTESIINYRLILIPLVVRLVILSSNMLGKKPEQGLTPLANTSLSFGLGWHRNWKRT